MYEIYDILENDNLNTIANKYNTTEEELIKINGLTKFNILQSKQIIVPKKNISNYNNYIVKKGDNIYKIAKDNNINYKLLLKINGLDEEDYIYPNQTLLIPKINLSAYLTERGDTLKSINDTLNSSTDKILDITNIYLEEEQIIFIEKNNF